MFWFFAINGSCVLIFLAMVFFCRRSYGPLARFMGYVTGQLLFNNNARSNALFAIATIFTVQFVIVTVVWGLPQSPLIGGAVEFTQSNDSLIEDSGLTDGLAAERLSAILSGNDPLTVVDAPSVIKIKDRPSNIWWLSVVLSWVLAFAYFPISRLDEVADLFSAMGRVMERRRSVSGQSESGSEQTQEVPSGSQPASTPVISPNWFSGLGVLKEFITEIVAEIVANKVTRR